MSSREYSCESWDYGPLLDTCIALTLDASTVVPIDTQRNIARALGLGTLYETIAEVSDGGRAVNDWISREISYGMWQLPGLPEVGAKVLGALDSRSIILICIPPEHARLALGAFPWDLDAEDDLQKAVVAHHAIISVVRRLAKAIAVRAALIQEEGWTYSLGDDAQGILIAPEIAKAGRFEGTPRDDLVELPLSC